MVWKVEIDKEADKELKKLDKTAQIKIVCYLRTKLATQADPKRFGEPLKANLSGLWRYRVGDYRLICKIEKEKLIVLVVSLGHRKNIYKKRK